MTFKSKASITCTECGYSKNFTAESDICAEDPKDSKEIATWEEDSIKLNAVVFEGLCPDCKYNKAA